MYGFDKSHHNIIDEKSPNKIKSPPIVGVPIFFTRWSLGPSGRIGFVIFFIEKKLMNFSPIKKTTIIDVIIAKPVLTVKKLKKFKNEYVSE